MRGGEGGDSEGRGSEGGGGESGGSKGQRRRWGRAEGEARRGGFDSSEPFKVMLRTGLSRPRVKRGSRAAVAAREGLGAPT